MTIDSAEYFFYEWLIIVKNMSEEDFNKLNDTEIQALKVEYYNICP